MTGSTGVVCSDREAALSYNVAIWQTLQQTSKDAVEVIIITVKQCWINLTPPTCCWGVSYYYVLVFFHFYTANEDFREVSDYQHWSLDRAIANVSAVCLSACTTDRLSVIQHRTILWCFCIWWPNFIVVNLVVHPEKVNRCVKERHRCRKREFYR